MKTIQLKTTWIALLVILTVTTTNIAAQDTLHFYKKSNVDKKFHLPLDDYYVFLKPEGQRRKKVIIQEYVDSTFIYAEWTYQGKNRRPTKNRIREMYADTSLTLGEIQRLAQSALYSKRDSIELSDLNKLIVPNRNRPEMKKSMTALDLSALSWIVIGIPALAIFQSLAYYATWNAIGAGIIIVAIIAENKTIKMSKWNLK
ncbi:MAG: hypothetical protein R2813_00625 [Flavobacteriales bacterium]